MNIDHIKDGQDRRGVLLSLLPQASAPREQPAESLPRLVAATLLTPEERLYLRGKGQAGRQALAERLQAARIGHLSLLHRPSLV
ncbi:MAG: hypothetical protein ACXV7J_15965 [Methylomonas sp.]